MATAVIMPRQGQSVESCVIGKWHKQKGDRVSIGDVLFTYETDKATFDEEAKVEGIILDIFFEEGDDVECLKTVCVIGEQGESIDEYKPSGATNMDAEAVKNGDEHAGAATDAYSAPGLRPDGPGPDDSVNHDDSGSVRVSPRARALAGRTGADISRAVPTGANGRVIERDVRRVIADGHMSTRAAQGDHTDIRGTGIGGRVTTADIREQLSGGEGYPPADTGIRTPAVSRPQDGSSGSRSASDFEEIKLTGVRKAIAKAMHASLADSAQLTLHSSFDATDILRFRKNLQAVDNAASMPKVSITDIIVFAVSRVVLNHKSINAHFLGDKMLVYNNAHIGVAVDTPRGLLVPTIRGANGMSLSGLSTHARELFERCRQGAVEPDALKGASFTISNLGALGIEMFTPVLNPPQTGLLGVCCTVERTKDGMPYPAMGLSLTFDHRALDGADAARFLKDLVGYLEKFSLNLAIEGGMF